VQGAFDVGEERVAAQRGGQPDRAGLAGPMISTVMAGG